MKVSVILLSILYFAGCSSTKETVNTSTIERVTIEDKNLSITPPVQTFEEIPIKRIVSETGSLYIFSNKEVKGSIVIDEKGEPKHVKDLTISLKPYTYTYKDTTKTSKITTEKTIEKDNKWGLKEYILSFIILAVIILIIVILKR